MTTFSGEVDFGVYLSPYPKIRLDDDSHTCKFQRFYNIGQTYVYISE